MPKGGEKPSYLDYLNQFNLWLESNALPGNAQLMYFKLLNIFNRAGWPEQVRVDTLRMMQMIDSMDKRTVYRARDKLAEAGFITYEKGVKGKPTLFTLLFIECKKPTESGTESGTKSSTKYSTKNGTRNGTHIKTLEEDQEKDSIPPKSPRGDTAPPVDFEGAGFGAGLQEALGEWLSYKRERREGYRPTGLKSLVTQIKNAAGEYGDSAVIGVIQLSMSSGYKGIVFDRLKGQSRAQGKMKDPIPDYKNTNREWSL